MSTKLSLHTQKFLDGINDKFRSQEAEPFAYNEFYASVGRKYDMILQSKRCHAFVDRSNGDIIKSGGRKPQRSTATGKLAVRHNVGTEEGYEAVIAVADTSGFYLYAERATVS